MVIKQLSFNALCVGLVFLFGAAGEVGLIGGESRSAADKYYLLLQGTDFIRLFHCSKPSPDQPYPLTPLILNFPHFPFSTSLRLTVSRALPSVCRTT